MNAKISHILELLGPAVLLPWASHSKGDRRKWKHVHLVDMKDHKHLAKLEQAGNIGVALGKVSDGLISIDFDDDYHADRFLEANPLSQPRYAREPTGDVTSGFVAPATIRLLQAKGCYRERNRRMES